MLNNVGRLDRLVRLLAAVLLLYLGGFVYGGSVLGVGLAVVGGVALFTGLFGACPLYGLLGINTRQGDRASRS